VRETTRERTQGKRSAGLPLSVGRASVATRLFLALVFLATAALCLGGGVLISREGTAPRVVAVVLIVPLGLIGLLAAAFILAPGPASASGSTPSYPGCASRASPSPRRSRCGSSRFF
jgi:hypothetical protein